MDSAEELQSYINKLQVAVEQGRQKLLNDGAEGRTEVGVAPPNQLALNFLILALHLKQREYICLVFCG